MPHTGIIAASSEKHRPTNAQATPARMNERMMPGPAYCAAAVPVSTKMPAPMIAPIPIEVMLKAPSVFASCRGPPSALSRMLAIGLRAMNPLLAMIFPFECGDAASLGSFDSDAYPGKGLPGWQPVHESATLSYD